MQKTVYLDSNDFSDLSKPEASLDESDKRVLDALRSARANGRAVFYISPIHLSEAVHASETYKESAVRRAALMSELAGDNLLRFPTDVCKLELDRVITGQDDPVCSLSQIVSGPGEWFGASPPDNLDDRRNEIRDSRARTSTSESAGTTPSVIEAKSDEEELSSVHTLNYQGWPSKDAFNRRSDSSAKSRASS